MAIKVLDAAVVGQIAAGEVVERPASVVKELVENAIDAGATSVTVEIKDGGLTYLRVTDNGCGIPASQIPLAFENHATSKLASAEQLSDIRTLGFRGEALPSIASVSRVEMTSRVKNAPAGARITIEGGVKQPVREIGCPEGTTVVMRDLFFNVPVRRTFLKKPAYEASLISDLVAKIIIGNPAVSFRFVNNGKNIYHSFGDNRLKHAIFAVYGAETADKMRDFHTILGGIEISGMIGVGDLSKPTRSHQAFFINGRTVKCALLTQALEQVCKGKVTIGEYPMCAISLKLPPASVDVNVHPNKLEVRFRDEQGIRASVEEMLTQAFNDERMLPEKRVEITEVLKTTVNEAAVPEKQTEVQIKPTKSVNKQTMVSNKPTIVSSIPTIVDKILADVENGTYKAVDLNQPALRESDDIYIPRAKPVETQEKIELIKRDEENREDEMSFRIIGTLFNTYILLETAGSLIMIDQHAAHERIMYEKYKNRLRSGMAASQELLAPVIIDVTAREMELLMENEETLRAAGYGIEPFGERSVSVRSVPFILGKADIRPIFLETLSSLTNIGTMSLESRTDEIAMMACKSAVKAGDKLSESEINALLKTMRETGASPTCPHGRPVFREMTRREIEKMFRRIQ